MKTSLVLTSVNNEKIKFIRSLKDKSARENFCMFVVEGWNIIKDLPKNCKVRHLVIEQSKLNEFGDIAQKYEQCLLVVSNNVMNALSDTKSPCGIIAVLDIPKENNKIEGNVVVLDGLTDSGNIGTIIRTCVACGVKNIVAINCADWTSGKVVRASMGGVFRVNICQTNAQKALEMLANHTIIALDMGGINIYEYSLPNDKKFALVVGSEAHGISDTFAQKSDEIISLPMTGDIESLNASIALSVSLFHLCYGKINN